jgi:hypothetical protein
MRIPPITIVVASCLAVGVTIPVVALAVGDDTKTGASSAPVMSEAAVAQFDDASAAAPDDAYLREREHIASMLPDSRGAIDLGPTSAELASASNGAVLLDEDGVRVSVIPTSRGDLCYVTSTGDVPDSGGCIQEFPDSGIVASMQAFTGGELPDQVRGLALDDVESVTVITASGAHHELDVSNGAFAWTGASADAGDRLAHVESVRGGETSSLDSPALGADGAER